MKPVLDACCGSRMFWFDRQNSDVVFMDQRQESHVLCDGHRRGKTVFLVFMKSTTPN